MMRGLWRSSPYRSRTWPDLGGPEETGRWASLQAAQLIGLCKSPQA
ncbi:MAG: hypothetical protein GWP61_01010 [Chloroflexi bacterium]|nr:hypothetical protein [Chloroflexota bacterium]